MPRETGAARTWFEDACQALDRGDVVHASKLLAWALSAVGEGEPALRAMIELLLSELAADSGDLGLAANLSVRAERGFMTAQDEAGFLAVWMARAERALASGDGELGCDIARWIMSRVDELGLTHARVWLRLHVAAWMEDCARPLEAFRSAGEALLIAPRGSGEETIAAIASMRALLELRRPVEAVELGSRLIDGLSGSVEVMGEMFLLMATALCMVGQPAEARVCATKADGLDSVGIDEARLRYFAADGRSFDYSWKVKDLRRGNFKRAPGKLSLTALLPPRKGEP